jgi:hypothetical protein
MNLENVSFLAFMFSGVWGDIQNFYEKIVTEKAKRKGGKNIKNKKEEIRKKLTKEGRKIKKEERWKKKHKQICMSRMVFHVLKMYPTRGKCQRQ